MPEVTVVNDPVYYLLIAAVGILFVHVNGKMFYGLKDIKSALGRIQMDIRELKKDVKKD